VVADATCGDLSLVYDQGLTPSALVSGRAE